MERPIIRQIEQQSETTREITGQEAEEILRRNGYGQTQQFSTRPIEHEPISPELTFEEMVRQHEEKERLERDRNLAIKQGPKPITFQSNNGYESEVKYGSDSELGFGFRIQITTDMKLPKY
jgi:hypothetical protein